jgi:hypothetical protein
MRGLATSRPGSVARSQSLRGRRRPEAGCPKPATRPHRDATVAGPVCSRRPGSDDEGFGRLLLEHGCLPEEADEFARAGDRDHPGRLPAPKRERAPAGMQAPLGPPGDLADAGILAGLPRRQAFVQARLVPVVVGGLNEQAAAVGGPGLGDRALAAPVVGGVLARHEADEGRGQPGVAEAAEVPRAPR